MASFQPFQLERWMSLHEQEVEYNLSESGVYPVRLSELLGDEPRLIDNLLATDLGYPHVNGIPQLRENIAQTYHGAGPENVLVTVGAAEANYITTRTLLEPGDKVACMLPNYMQIWGVAMNHACPVRPFYLREENNWALDRDELEMALTPGTKLMAVCNPNNPTGRILTEGEMDAIVAAAGRVGAWILADEVYRGADRRSDGENPSFYGRYDKVIAVGSMSKAYGLPGLRIGWLVAPRRTVDDIWMRHEYTTISASALSNQLAALALSREIRPRLLARTRRYIRNGFPILHEWLEDHPDTFSLIPPDAGAIAFLHYHLDINSTQLAQRLLEEQSVLIVPGDHFGMDHFIRVSFGLPAYELVPALDRIHDLIVKLEV